MQCYARTIIAFIEEMGWVILASRGKTIMSLREWVRFLIT